MPKTPLVNGSSWQSTEQGSINENQRTLRRKYRDLIKNTEGNPNKQKLQDLELESENCDNLLDNISKANTLFSRATLDSKVLVLSAGIGIKKAHKLKVQTRNFEKDKFIENLKHLMIDEPDGIYNIGLLGSRFIKRFPTCDSLLGPLKIEPKVRAPVTKRQKLNKNEMLLEKPVQLTQEDISKDVNEGNKIVRDMAKLLVQNAPVNLFIFVINPTSFSQTIENIFYLSFLVHDNKAVYYLENGEPIISTISDSSTQNTNINKKQCIFDLDEHSWKSLIKLHKIKKSIIPTRFY